MDALFLKILNMSINASWLVLAVVVLRLLLQKAPKAINVVMWALVGIRLICPFSIESVFSLIPSAEPISLDPSFSNPLTNYDRIPVFSLETNPIISYPVEYNVDNSFSLKEFVTITASEIWIIGIIIMLLYTIVSYWRIHRKVREAIPFKDNIYLCDHISTPFIFGIIRPKIYLLSAMAETDTEYIIAHENAHIQRQDHLWKPLGFLLLIIHWFNPLIWLAYILLCTDIELACDEKVIKDMGIDSKKPYSTALINCSVPNKILTACPLAFGEVGVKTRVKTVLNYKKPAFWISTTAVIACIAVAVCFLTNPAGISINQINDANGFGHIFKDVKTLEITKEGYGFKVESIDSVVKDLKKIRLDPNPVSQNVAINRGKTYQIIINYTDTLCFNSDFSELWINTTTVPSYSYTIQNPDIVEEIFNEHISANNPSNTIPWVFSPVRSATFYHILELTFDFDYTHIETSCSDGSMQDLSNFKDGQPRASRMNFDKDTTVCWSPFTSDPDNSEPVPEADIDFTVYNNNEELYSGKILIRTEDSENFFTHLQATYKVQLIDCDGLSLQQNSFYTGTGGVIFALP